MEEFRLTIKGLLVKSLVELSATLGQVLHYELAANHSGGTVASMIQAIGEELTARAAIMRAKERP